METDGAARVTLPPGDRGRRWRGARGPRRDRRALGADDVRRARVQLQGWGPATLDADDLYSTNLHSKSPFSHFRDERLDRLVEEGRSTLDKERRLRVYREIARYHHEEATHLFLWQSVNIYGVSKRLVWSPRPDEYLKMYEATLK